MGKAGGSVDLTQLIALNDEIAALVRAGVPLERGLSAAGGSLPGRLGAISSKLAARMEQGEGLSEALAAEGDSFPPIYRSVVEAGVKSGRLAAALEGLAGFARGYAEMRREVGLALLYPAILLVVATGLSLVLVVGVTPRLVAIFGELGLRSPGFLVGLAGLREWAWVWGPLVPALVALVTLGWFASRKSASLQPGWSGGVLRWVPWMGGMLAAARAANFAEMLALLLDHGVPYAESLRLAARATGDVALARHSGRLAEADERGEPISVAMAAELPPLLAWLMSSGGGGERGRVGALRAVAASYRRRAIERASLIRVFLPTILLLVVGGTTVLAYGLTLFVPVSELLSRLSSPD
ncbi:type II secretion system F family protein [Isosphaeraceae bacterium EP7]